MATNSSKWSSDLMSSIDDCRCPCSNLHTSGIALPPTDPDNELCDFNDSCTLPFCTDELDFGELEEDSRCVQDQETAVISLEHDGDSYNIYNELTLTGNDDLDPDLNLFNPLTRTATKYYSEEGFNKMVHSSTLQK